MNYFNEDFSHVDIVFLYMAYNNNNNNNNNNNTKRFKKPRLLNLVRSMA